MPERIQGSFEADSNPDSCLANNWTEKERHGNLGCIPALLFLQLCLFLCQPALLFLRQETVSDATVRFQQRWFAMMTLHSTP